MSASLIAALDLGSRAAAETLIEKLGDAVDFYKIGYQLVYGGDGLALGKDLIAQGKRHHTHRQTKARQRCNVRRGARSRRRQYR